MADEVDDVLDQYGKVEGLDPKLVKGAIEDGSLRSVMPLANTALPGSDREEPEEPKTPMSMPALPEMAASVDASIPEASEIKKALTNPAVNDKLVEVVRRDDSTVTILNTLMEEIAEDAAYLKAWRNTVWDGQKDISESVLSRTKMLSEFVKALSEREKLKREKAVGKVDFHSENFQNVLKYFMSVIIETFRKVQIPPQYEDIFVTQLAKEFDGFEKKAEKIYYGKGK